jgi:hypothetical protein
VQPSGFYRVTQKMNDLSRLSLKRHLGSCDRTAWWLKQKLLEIMAERESSPLLIGGNPSGEGGS